MENKNKYALKLIFTITSFSIGYAILRYHLFDDVPWKDLPIFVLNKGISLSSLVLLTLTFCLSPLKNMGIKIKSKWLDSRKMVEVTGFLFAFLHVFMSMTILNPKYYPVFFVSDGTLSLRGNLSLLGAVLGFAILWAYRISFKSIALEYSGLSFFVKSKNSIVYILFFTSIHIFLCDIQVWPP